MDVLTGYVNQFTAKVSDLVNHSHLHPTVAKLVLLNIVNQLETIERQMVDESSQQTKQGCTVPAQTKDGGKTNGNPL